MVLCAYTPKLLLSKALNFMRMMYPPVNGYILGTIFSCHKSLQTRAKQELQGLCA